MFALLLSLASCADLVLSVNKVKHGEYSQLTFNHIKGDIYRLIKL